MLSAGLPPVDSKLVKALCVTKAPIVIEYKLFKALELGSHTLFVNCIIDVKVKAGLETGSGGLDIFKVNLIIYSTIGSYHKVGPVVG